MDGLGPRGWRVFPAEAAVTVWVDAVRPIVDDLLADPDLAARWLRHGGTWFAGVDVLPNNPAGRVGQGPALGGAALDAAFAATGPLPLHPGQVSAVHPGYPGRDGDETEAAHRYQTQRAAAHVDGLLPIGPARRRHLREPHAFILGLPVTDSATGAAPLTVWEGSQTVIRAALAGVLAPHAPADWPGIDLTEAYHAARRTAFETCRRHEIAASPGQAILLHRHLLHGIAPWRADPGPPRVVVYFRPELPDLESWLSKD